MKRFIFPTCIVLGISLFAIFARVEFPIVGLSMILAISDIVIALLLVYALFSLRSSIRSPVLPATLVLASVLLLSGIVNAWTDDTFDSHGFMINYLRIIGIVAMVLLLPGLARKIGHARLAQSTLWVSRLHALLILADSIFDSPITWSDVSVVWSEGAADFSRPRGLFGEPAWFAVYMGVSLAYILQVERNTGTRYIRVTDIVLIGLALVASASVSAIIVLGLFLLVLVLRRGLKHKAKVSIGIAVFALFVGVSVIASQDTALARNWDYILDKLGSMQPQRFLDPSSMSLLNDSVRQRFIGSGLMVSEILSDSPLLGTGLGGTNTRRLLDRYVWRDQDSGRVASLSLANMSASVIAAGGLLGLLPFLFILLWISVMPEMRLIGLSLFAVGFLWGGVFEPIIWWHICLAVSLKGAYGRIATLRPTHRAVSAESGGREYVIS